MGDIPAFGRDFLGSGRSFSRIGDGALGGKGEGLVRAARVLGEGLEGGAVEGLRVEVPRVVIVATGVFEAFMERGNLWDVVAAGPPDDRLALAFQKADLPAEVTGDLRALVEGVRTPLAVRSSSLLEDALDHPFAGVYETKMTPNDQADAGARFRALTEAVKLVWASTFLRSARSYRRAVGARDEDERMAVVVQEVVGARYGERFYPHVSGVARSYNFYPQGAARPDQGVVSLALGLGKTIVDGGVCWSYSPAHPRKPPPFQSARELVSRSQSRFWAVHMGRPAAYDPVSETEYLVEYDLGDAEYDGTLDELVSTYDARSDRLRPGAVGDGPRVVDFAPILRLGERPLNAAVLRLLDLCEEVVGRDVEIEFALTLPRSRRDATPARLGLVQVRATAAPDEAVALDVLDLRGGDVLLSSARALGHHAGLELLDVVYVVPERFEARNTRRIAEEIDVLNRKLMEAGRPYLLIGFGRWGSSDPWLGIPVTWGHVAGAGALVEATLPSMNVEPSQGSHFFHNLSSLGGLYLAAGPGAPRGVDWDELAARDAVEETEHLRHVRLPVVVTVDGRSSRGVVRRSDPG